MYNPSLIAAPNDPAGIKSSSITFSIHIAVRQQRRINIRIRLIRGFYLFLPSIISDFFLYKLKLAMIRQIGQVKKITDDIRKDAAKKIIRKDAEGSSLVLPMLLRVSRETVSLLCEKPTNGLVAIKELRIVAEHLTDFAYEALGAIKIRERFVFPEPVM